MKIPSLVVFLNVRFKDTLAIHVLQRPDVAIVILQLGDFWNYQSDDIIVDDDRGVSVVLANTEKGIHFLEGLTLTRREFGEVMMKIPLQLRVVRVACIERIFIRGLITSLSEKKWLF